MNLQFQCAKTCSDGGLLALSCTGPEMCGGNPCCIDVGLGGGGGLSAGAVGCGMQGMNSCVPKIDFGAQALKTRFCHQDPDCGGGGALCCTAHAGMANLNICIDAQTMQFLGMLGGLVTCP